MEYVFAIIGTSLNDKFVDPRKRRNSRDCARCERNGDVRAKKWCVKTDHVVPRDVSVERPEVKSYTRPGRRCGRRAKESCDAAPPQRYTPTNRFLEVHGRAQVLRTPVDLGMSVILRHRHLKWGWW